MEVNVVRCQVSVMEVKCCEVSGKCNGSECCEVSGKCDGSEML